jgi:hypothetical protein
MGNLGDYQTITKLAKTVGGPRKLAALVALGGYGLVRCGEAATRWAIREVSKRNAPCATKGRVFRATVDGSERDLRIRAGDTYRVLECDGDAILVELPGDEGSPYFASSRFLRSISNFPQIDGEEGAAQLQPPDH